MEHTIYEKKVFELINKDGKLTWIEKGKKSMTTVMDKILSETQDYVRAGSPLPDFSNACWIPFYKSSTNFGYALVDTKSSKVVATLPYRNNGFFEGNIIHPEGRYLGEFVDALKAKLFIEEKMYGKLLAEFDLYIIEEFVVSV
jgi:hypothetical protein